MSTQIANPTLSASSAVATMPKSSDLVPDNPAFATDDIFSQFATAGNFLPYIQLASGSSNAAKEGKAMMGSHSLHKNKEIIDLGKNIQCWVCAWRPMTMLLSGEKPVTFFNPNGAGFKKVQEIAAGGYGSQGMCGIQFLLYLPQHGFVTYYLSSKTALNEAGNFKALIDKCAVISSKLIDDGKNKWHGVSINVSSVVLDTPNMEEYKAVLTNFKNPVESNVELVNKAPTPVGAGTAPVAPAREQ